MVWGAVCGAQKGPLIFWDKKNWGNITSAGFIGHIFPSLYDFWLDMSTSDPDTPFYVMMDNAPAHTAKSTKQVFEQAQIPLLPWPASSPDLNPIENIWRILKDRLDTRRAGHTTRAELMAVVQEEWDRIGARELDLHIDSMPRRIQDVIEARGGPTKW
jgi:hypothetical protein